MDIVLLMVACASNCLLGVLVFMQNQKGVYVRWFLALTLLLSAWVIANFFTNHYYGSIDIVGISNRMAYMLGIAAFASGAMFTYEFPRHIYRTRKETAIVWVLVVGMMVFTVTPYVSGSVELKDGDLLYISGTMLPVYIVALVALLMLALGNLAVRARVTDPAEKKHVQLIFVAFFVSALIGIFANLILPFYGQDWNSTRFGPFAMVVLVALIAYSITRHRLFDIRFAAVRTIAYLLSLATMALLYFGMAYFVSVLFFRENAASFTANAANIAIALVLAIAFQPIKHFFDRATDRFFYFGNYNPDDFIAELGTILTSTTDLKSLLIKINAKIDQTFRASWSSFAVLKRESGIIQVGSGAYTHVTNETVLRLYDVSGRTSSIIQVGNLLESKISAHRQFAQQLSKDGVVMILPLLRTDSHVGYLLIGDRRAGRYTRRDIRVLETVSNELVIAIQNALSVQEVRDVNTNLQQRIDQATERLRLTNERLQKLDETKDEFISMASHQLRTPLTSIKGYLSMVLDGDVGAVNDQQRKFLSEAYTSSERMVRLIGDFLNVSRLQTGKFIVERRPADLGQVVHDEVKSMQRLAASHGIRMLFQADDTIPNLLIDEDKIRQVIMNLLDNAIYYSSDGTVVAVKLYAKYHWINFEVHDQGIGVPLRAQGQLFTKFFRADNARNQRPDGTGVGLFLAKKVVTALEGEMIFESYPGKGSVFGFRLPIKKLRTPNWDSH